MAVSVKQFKHKCSRDLGHLNLTIWFTSLYDAFGDYYGKASKTYTMKPQCLEYWCVEISICHFILASII